MDPNSARCEVVIEPGRRGCSGPGEDEDDAELSEDTFVPGIAASLDTVSALNVPYELMGGITGSRTGVGKPMEEVEGD